MVLDIEKRRGGGTGVRCSCMHLFIYEYGVVRCSGKSALGTLFTRA